MTDAASAISALLTARGHTTWLVGGSARDHLAPAGAARARTAGPTATEPAYAELLTDAPSELAAEVQRTAVSALSLGPIRLDTLDGIPLMDWLRARGITIDAIAVDVATGVVTDPFDGAAHLAAGSLRTVLPPEHAFREDPILLLRVARIQATTGAVPASDLRRFAVRDAGNLLDVRHRRSEWAAELNLLLLGEHIERALQSLYDMRVLAITMPEVAAMVGFDKSCSVHHKDIWEHTKLVTQKAQPDLVVRWTALCHDIGKVWTRSVNRDGKVHFFRHEEHGAFLFEGIAHRVGLDETLMNRVIYVIENHSRVNLYRDDWSDSAVRRLIRETTGHLPDLVAFSKADFTTKRESKIAELKRQMADLEERLIRVEAEDAVIPPLSKGIGTAIMAHFGLSPSRVVGELKQLLERTIDTGALPPRADDALYLAWLTTSEAAGQLLGRVPAASAAPAPAKAPTPA